MQFLRWSDYRIDTPKPYGAFHLVFLIIMIIVAIMLVIFAKKIKNSAVDKIILGFGIGLLIIEIYKQLFFTYISGDGEYLWYSFPFQFCSSPMYVMLIVPFIKNEKVKKCLYGYLAYYGTIGGLSVMLYPADVFIGTLSICIHTMLWHGSMSVLGIFLLAKQNYGRKIVEIVPGFITLGVFMMIATLLNIVCYHTFIKDLGATFNMFFISPYFPSTLPILSIIHEKFGWVALIICYLLAFSLAAALVFGVVKLIKKVTSHSSRLIKN